ncbi:MAG: MoxR family ATPase [Methanomassiliicoccales archaeon]|nr:MoxR family ATPase [Methanomassiliicoccales archaeon]
MEIAELKSKADDILRTVGEVFVGDPKVPRHLLCGALAGGHVLFEDYPGLGKTLLAKTFARAIGCVWGRVQFTPDLVPADIIGTRIWRPRTSEFAVEKGPIFTNVLLADEINRAPPKTQSALLEAMEERQVTIEGTTYPLDRPFFVMATQNPIEHEGTFPLPEAQLDRFLLRMSTGYVSTLGEESEILRRRVEWRTDDPSRRVLPAVDQGQLLEMQDLVESGIYVDSEIVDYVSSIVRATRKHPSVQVGSSPRGGLALLKASRANAAICGRDFVTPDDVKTFVDEALTHRIILRMEYQMDENTSVSAVVAEVVSKVEAPSALPGRRDR